MQQMNEIIGKLSLWFGCANDYDCMPGRRISDSDKNQARLGFNIPRDEEIYFMRDTGFWNNRDQGLVMTNKGLHVIVDNDSPEEKFIIEWKEFDRVEYQELVFYFYCGDQLVGNLHYDYLLKCGDDDVQGKQSRVCEMLNSMAALVSPDIDPLQEANEGRFDVALAEAERQLAENPEDVRALFVMGRVAYLEQCNAEEKNESKLEKTINLFRKAISLTEEHGWLMALNNHIAFCCELVNNSFGARYAYVRALEYAEDLEDRKFIMNEIRGQEEQLKDTWNHFTEIYEYKDRKFCMPVRDEDIGGCVVSDVDVFMMSNIPSQFCFPTGHPYPNQLYIGHPYKKELYVPYEESEDLFFMDKVNELCYLIECLGAESIEITSIKGKNVSEMKVSAEQLSGSADFGYISGSGEVRNSTKSSNDSSQRTSRSFTIKLDPMKAPYLPDGLVWYKEQPQWQRLVERRLNNNILEYTENVQSSDTRFTTGSEVNEVKGQAEYLWSKVGGTAIKNVETHFKTSVDTEWRISVKFRSLKDFVSNMDMLSEGSVVDTVPQLSPEEKEYLDEYRLCLADGAMSDTERRLLAKLASTLKLTPDQIVKIESSVNPQLSSDEQEYLEEYRLCREDGEITPSGRRLLDRIARSLNLSNEQIKKVESLY